MFKRVNHIGLAVKDVDQATKLWTEKFGVTAEPAVIEGNMKIVMLHVGDVLVELIGAVGNEGVMAKFLEKRGEGLHHICFEVEDIRAAMKELTDEGIPLVDKEPREGAEGLIAFLHPKATHGTLTEICQVRD